MATTAQTLAAHAPGPDPTHIITCVEDGGIERISAHGTDHAEICGAFKPAGHCTWSIYVTRPLVEKAPRSHPWSMPAHCHVSNCSQARQWVEIIAHLYHTAQTR